MQTNDDGRPSSITLQLDIPDTIRRHVNHLQRVPEEQRALYSGARYQDFRLAHVRGPGGRITNMALLKGWF